MTRGKLGELIAVVRLSPEGRELLREIDAHCGYKCNIFNAQNARQNDFNQGKQSVAVWLHDALDKHEKKENDEE
jgi:hypothetical protein